MSYDIIFFLNYIINGLLLLLDVCWYSGLNVKLINKFFFLFYFIIFRSLYLKMFFFLFTLQLHVICTVICVLGVCVCKKEKNTPLHRNCGCAKSRNFEKTISELGIAKIVFNRQSLPIYCYISHR